MDVQEPRRLSMEERKAFLERVLMHEVSLGARVESLMDVMAIVTVGQRRVTLAIDEHGQVLVDGKPTQPVPRAPADQASVPVPRSPVTQGSLGIEERKALLERVLMHEVSLGARVESQTNVMAIVTVGQRRVTLAINEHGHVLVDGKPAQPAPRGPPEQVSAPAPRSSAAQVSGGGVAGFVTRNPFVAAVAAVLCVVFLASFVTVAGSARNTRRAVVTPPTQGQAIHNIDAVSFLPPSAGFLSRTQIQKAPRGNVAWAKYATTAHPGVEAEVQARWEGPEFDDQLSAGGRPADMAGRRVYVSGPNVYDQLKIRWADRGWHYYVRLSYSDEVARQEAEGIAQSVASDIITNGTRLTSSVQ